MGEPLDVLLFGLGAQLVTRTTRIGSFYAFILNNSKRVRLSVCARSNYDAVQANGVTIDSENHGKHTFKPFKVVKSPDEAGIKFDYIVCANKAINPDSVMQLLAPVVDEVKTTIVIFQNGVGNEDPFREAFPRCTIISGVVWVGAIQSRPGYVNHTKSENTEIGLFPNSAVDAALEKQRLDEFVSLMLEGGTHVDIVPNVQVQKWEKCTWNAAWNSLTTLTDLDTQSWFASSEDAIPLSRKVMREMIDVAKACGVPIGYELIDKLMDRILSMPGTATSMQTDARHGRHMEVDIILGSAVRKARQLNVQIPVVEALFVILQAVNYRMAQKQQ